MTILDPREEVKTFLRSMASVGVEVTVVWRKGEKGEATSNQGADGLARATAALAIKGDALTRAGRALHKHMLSDDPGEWEELPESERETIRTMCKVVIAAALEPQAPTPRIIRPV